MPAPSRPVVLICAALAVATPALAGSMAWHYLDDDDRSGLLYVILFWPSILLSHLPDRAEWAFTVSALPMVLLYFAGYLLACQAVRALFAIYKRRTA
jgi:hypothetical protein